MIANRKIRIAIVGCGRISSNHFGSIEKHANEIELVAICDTNAKVLNEHEEKYKVPAYNGRLTYSREHVTDLGGETNGLSCAQ